MGSILYILYIPCSSQYEGLWIFSLIADVIYLWHGKPVWRDWIAFYTLLGGIIGAAAATAPCFIDWFSIKDPEVKKLANWHARLNVIALLVPGIRVRLVF